jgi:hypothetical protein
LLIGWQGLAQTAVHNIDSEAVPFKSLLDSVQANFTAEDLYGAVDSSRLSGSDSVAAYPNVHALTILARILDDADLAPTGEKDLFRIFEETATKKGTKIWEHVSQWTVDLKNPNEINKKIEELQWLYTVIYALSGYKPGQEFKANFFL